MLYLFVAWLRILGEQRVGQQDHTRGAVTAFKAAFFPKRPLNRMKFIALGQAFDGVTVLPSISKAGVVQELTGLPSTRTVHAPQISTSQLFLVPLRPK